MKTVWLVLERGNYGEFVVSAHETEEGAIAAMEAEEITADERYYSYRCVELEVKP